MQQLTSAISSGDLQGAQSAYSTLTNLQQSSGASASSGALGQFLTNVGADLGKGDLTTAQSDLSTFQKAQGGHHHRPSTGGADSSSTASATASADTASTPTSSTNILDISA